MIKKIKRLFTKSTKIRVMGLDNQEKQVKVTTQNKIYNLRMLNKLYWLK